MSSVLRVRVREGWTSYSEFQAKTQEPVLLWSSVPICKIKCVCVCVSGWVVAWVGSVVCVCVYMRV